jgi:Leucine carboxyl methyltransferase
MRKYPGGWSGEPRGKTTPMRPREPLTGVTTCSPPPRPVAARWYCSRPDWTLARSGCPGRTECACSNWTFRRCGASRRVLTARQALPKCTRSVVAADLREDWPARLVETGLKPAEPTAWLAEGLLTYLTADQAAHVLSAVGGLIAKVELMIVDTFPTYLRKSVHDHGTGPPAGMERGRPQA